MSSVIAPGSVVVVRDEEWLVTGIERSPDGQLLTLQGLSELVRDTTATFYDGLEESVEVLDPAEAKVVADGSSQYRRARLWVEATLRRTAVPLDDVRPGVSTRMLATPLDYQQTAVRLALDPAKLRPRILLADAVGLGKTLEIGMILAELVRRGRGERILIVTPKHVLEQFQHEMWTRFALPFVRLDSVGIQRVRQKLPATRNPFTYFKRAIISIDTLKSDRYLAHLRRQRWDAVVIDESHNLTNSGTQNNRLARVLAPNADALILASATPHNGKPESFAELIRLLEPTAVRPDGTLVEQDVQRLVIRRHRNSPEVARAVGADWAPRKEPQNFLVPASEAENAIAAELEQTWLYPLSGRSPYSGGTGAGTAAKLFGWTLAKAFLSSPAALTQTTNERLRRLGDPVTEAQEREVAALILLRDLAAGLVPQDSGKYRRLKEYLGQIGVGPRTPTRMVVFAERIATLAWLQKGLCADLGLSIDQVPILHGTLPDDEQQGIVESFKLLESPIRVLVTSDIASEGVNFHLQCHELVHFDIPWSLIRIEQRNGRIDRYGQRHSPQITSLLLDPDGERFAGDLRVLSRLLEKEREAHTALGDVASLMGKYDVGEEEDEIRKVLAGERSLDDVVAPVDDPSALDPVAALLARIAALPAPGATGEPDTEALTVDTPAGTAETDGGLYDDEVAFLRDALEEVFLTPEGAVAGGGVHWREYPAHSTVELVPPADLRQRLAVLPQSYLADRKVLETFKLATSTTRGNALLREALGEGSDSSWPEAHYLGPLHPVLDWIGDRVLAALGRNQVFAVRGNVEDPTVLLVGTLTNRRGQVIASSFQHVEFPDPDHPGFAPVTPYPSAAEMLAAVGVRTVAGNPGPPDVSGLQHLIRPAVAAATTYVRQVFTASEKKAQVRAEDWSARAGTWQDEAKAGTQRELFVQRRATVAEEQVLADAMAPDRQLVRPLLLVLPADHPTAGETP
jgi:superfamily II DNA or RNA helicase